MWNRVVTVLFVLWGTERGLCTVDNSPLELRTKGMAILDEIVKHGRYDPRVRPAAANGTAGPTRVELNVLLQRIPRVSDVDMEMDTLLTVNQKWLDERLKFDDLDGKIKHLTLTDAKKIWLPDTFVDDRVGQLVNSIGSNCDIRIQPDGSVIYSIRAASTISCPMSFRRFPLDAQSCLLSISSFGYSKNDLVLNWRDQDAVQVAGDLQVPRFRFKKFQPADCLGAERRSCLAAEVQIQRQFPHFLVQIYVPCSMLVIMSWLTFWLDHTAIGARTFLSAAALLAMTFHSSNYNATLPQVPYTKAIDVWTGTCMTFVFNVLVVVVRVNYVSRRDKRRTKNRRRDYGLEMGPTAAAGALVADEPRDDEEDKVDVPSADVEDAHQRDSLYKTITTMCSLNWLVRRYPSAPKRIDVVSRVLFPVAFLLFIGFYYLMYCPDN